MGRITIDQSHKIMAALAENVDWGEVDFELAGLQDAIIRNAREAGERFTAFLKNGGRMTIGNPKVLTLNPANTFNPAKFISKGHSVWKGSIDSNGLFGVEEKDERSLVLTAVDFSRVQFLTCLKEGETSIEGKEKLKRLKKSGLIRFGGNVFYALWQDYKANGKTSVLEWLRINLNITYLDFFGLVLRCESGHGVLYLRWYKGSGWSWGETALDGDFGNWGEYHVSAVWCPQCHLSPEKLNCH